MTGSTVPELPELQAHAERLTRQVCGRVLQEFAPLNFTVLKTVEPPPTAAAGHALTLVSRLGKYLLVQFGNISFVVHLMQGGRLIADPKPSTSKRGVRARWRFADGTEMVLTEPGTERRAGVWCAYTDRLDRTAPLTSLGPDALHITVHDLATSFVVHPMRLHNFLRDQRMVAGLGRRLANEICHAARLSPFANTAQLSADAVSRVHDAIVGCCASSLEQERDNDEMLNSKSRLSMVHARTGEPCPSCGAVIRSVEYADYTVNYCATCQTGGRILADNTTSKFLK